MSIEEPLASGMNAEGVVRIGDTVRRPTGPWTPAVHAFLRHLEHKEFPAAPRVLGLDETGREILTYAPGHTAGRGELAHDDRLHRAAALVGLLHRLSSTFEPPADAVWRPPGSRHATGTVLHGDLGGWNVIINEDGDITFIDWDDATPGDPLWEAGYSLLAFGDLWPDSNNSDADAAHRIRVYADGYELTRDQLTHSLELVPVGLRLIHDGILRGADRGHPPAIRMRDAGTHLAWLGAAEHWERRAPEWARLATHT